MASTYYAVVSSAGAPEVIMSMHPTQQQAEAERDRLQADRSHAAAYSYRVVRIEELE